MFSCLFLGGPDRSLAVIKSKGDGNYFDMWNVPIENQENTEDNRAREVERNNIL